MLTNCCGSGKRNNRVTEIILRAFRLPIIPAPLQILVVPPILRWISDPGPRRDDEILRYPPGRQKKRVQ
jgi:hypothetical protein